MNNIFIFILTTNNYNVYFIIIIDNVKHIDAILGENAELLCDIQNIKNSTEWPILIIWYKGQDYPIYR